MSPILSYSRQACRAASPAAALRSTLVLMVAILSVVATSARAGTSRKDKRAEPDLVAIAAVILEGGDAARAISILQSIPPEADHIDRVRLATILGLAALQVHDHPLARASLQSAVEQRERSIPPASAGLDEATAHELRALYGHLALATHGQGDCPATLAALARAGTWAEERVVGFVMRADCLQRAGDSAAALDALRAGQSRHAPVCTRPSPGPAEDVEPGATLWEREFRMLASLSLFQELLERAEGRLPCQSGDEAIRLLGLLHEVGAYDTAIMLGERMRGWHAGSSAITVALAHAYAATGSPLAAAQLFEDAARQSPEHVLDAAALYRSAGWLTSAELLTARAADGAQKLRQRFGLLLEQERFDEANALRARLLREGLLEDDEIRYALAYSLFQSRELEEARRTLRGIQSAALFRQAAELSSAIAACEREGWQCR